MKAVAVALVAALAAGPALVRAANPLAGGFPEPAQLHATPSGDCGGAARHASQLYLAAPAALALGWWRSSAGASGSRLGSGFAALAGGFAGVSLAAAGTRLHMRCQPGAEPRRWLWAAGFIPVAAALASQVASDDPRPFGERQGLLLGSAFAASIAWFGVVAFTGLGYRPRYADERASSFSFAPRVLSLRGARGWTPGLGWRARF